MLRLNLGAGGSPLDGYVNVDRNYEERSGSNSDGVNRKGEAYPLGYHADCADEVRASHVLEHFSHRDTAKVIAEWVRVLKPGGILKLAVPDLNKVLALAAQEPGRYPIEGYIMGGHVDENDRHGAVFTEAKLRKLMEEAGLVDIGPWTSETNDCAALPISLNLMGRKPDAKPEPKLMPEGTPLDATKTVATTQNLKVAAILSRPRFGLNDFWDCATTALRPFNIPLRSFRGVFWGQCMQRAFNECCEQGIDWILTLDYDSLFTAQHISTLFDWLGKRPDIDALAALQCRRGQPHPLMTQGANTRVELDGQPILATTAHFGLTVLRVEALKKCKKPWFFGQPDKDGEWGDERLDDDIWFWHQWRLAGNTIYVAPDCSIGHMEEMVAEFDPVTMEARHVYVREWRERHGMDAKKGGK